MSEIKKYSLIITNDYEVYGDGTGCPENVLIRPTEDLLKTCRDFGVPMTLFVDVLEIRAFREAEDTGIFGSQYKAASRVEYQLKQAKACGHDAQLHLHPQWIGAKPISPDKWMINPNYWRLPYVPGGLGTPEDKDSLLGLFSFGKHYLENLLQPIDHTYKCVAFRAGGYCIQPEGDVLRAMSKTGFSIDSSVCPGRYTNKSISKCDFRNAPRKLPYWKITDSVTDFSDYGKLLEIPIFTSRHSYRNLYNVLRHGSPRWKMRYLKRLVKRTTLNFDFCKLTTEEMKFLLVNAMIKYKSYSEPVPIVLTGHSKEYKYTKDLSKFLAWATKINDVRFTTFSDWLTCTGKMHT